MVEEEEGFKMKNLSEIKNTIEDEISQAFIQFNLIAPSPYLECQQANKDFARNAERHLIKASRLLSKYGNELVRDTRDEIENRYQSVRESVRSTGLTLGYI